MKKQLGKLLGLLFIGVLVLIVLFVWTTSFPHISDCNISLSGKFKEYEIIDEKEYPVFVVQNDLFSSEKFNSVTRTAQNNIFLRNLVKDERVDLVYSERYDIIYSKKQLNLYKTLTTCILVVFILEFISLVSLIKLCVTQKIKTGEKKQMITLERTAVMNLDNAIRGARNPMNSWDRMDSKWLTWEEGAKEVYNESLKCPNPDAKYFCLGENDIGLAVRLRKAGSDHRKYLRQIFVSVDINAPEFWWLEFDTYKLGTVCNSCSKMHKLLDKPIEISDFSLDGMTGYKKIVKQEAVYDLENENWKEHPTYTDYLISDQGRVLHKGYFNARGQYYKEKILAPLYKKGYYSVNVRLQTNQFKHIPIHVLVAETWLVKPQSIKKLEVNHKDGNKLNNCASNLEWLTSSENTIHAFETGLQARGLRTYRGKFTKEERDKIKEEYNTIDISKRQLAKKYNVSHTCIINIINDDYAYQTDSNAFKHICETIKYLEELRLECINCEDEDRKKKLFRSIIELLPMSYNQMRTVTMNYENLVNMYHARKNHKLSEWHTFCDWVETLPYAKELIICED